MKAAIAILLNLAIAGLCIALGFAERRYEHIHVTGALHDHVSGARE